MRIFFTRQLYNKKHVQFFCSYLPSETNIPGHDGHPLGMDGAQIGILEKGWTSKKIVPCTRAYATK